MQTRGVIESVVFSVANTLVMVCGMLTFNLWIHDCLGGENIPDVFFADCGGGVCNKLFIVAPLIKATALRFHIEKYIPFMMPFMFRRIFVFAVCHDKNVLCA